MTIEITKDHILNARTYLQIGAKARLAEQIAGWCVQPVEESEETAIPTPPLYKENRAIKNLLMTGILARYYLNLEFECQSVRLMENGTQVGEQPIDFYPTMEAYDNLASSNIINQLERLKKSEKDVSNTIFDLMYDFKLLEQMVNSEIRDYVAQKNDVMIRLIKTLEIQMSEDNLKALTVNLEELQKEIKKYKKEG